MSYQYIEPYKTADKILRLFETKSSRMAEYDINARCKEKGCDPDIIRTALKQLGKDGYIQVDGILNDWFVRTGTGAILLANGGYDRHFYNLNQQKE